ncbi:MULTISPECIES: hypothetical protein [Sphingomonas]|uniref:hypothetical protein n=1 Tax=Sphingomonas TaxID=13687 RepID=UPI00082BC6AF|nr:hypothetical protein [Sphingomonas sp. CCH10-B3]
MILAIVLGGAMCTGAVILPQDSPIPLVTAQPLSSKAAAKGDIVALRTSADVVVDGTVVIPAGTAATGQVTEARGTGAMGQSGKLALAPLYIRIGDTTIRLTGSAGGHGTLSAGQVIGLGFVSSVFSGRSATIAAGTPVAAQTLRSASLPCPVGQ